MAKQGNKFSLMTNGKKVQVIVAIFAMLLGAGGCIWYFVTHIDQIKF